MKKSERNRFFVFEQEHDYPEDRELIVDLFAGGGGASIGIKRGCGFAPDAALNHDAAAIGMHQANHPETRHFPRNIWDVDPVELTEGRPVGLAWFSPDCTHHSKAKGGKPREQKIRALAWAVLRWALKTKPRVIMLENVEEFLHWGPLDKHGNIIEHRKGETFRAFTGCLECGIDPDSEAAIEAIEYLGEDEARECFQGLGYTVEWQEVTASDYGAPTSRKRLFLIARCDDEPIVWPEPTHGSPEAIRLNINAFGSTNRQPWKTAGDIIDWSIPCPSIFASSEEIQRKHGVKAIRPLADKTMRRIAEGIRRYVIETHAPYIVKVNHGGDDFRGQAIDEPLQTITQRHGYGVVTPYIMALQHGGKVRAADRPLHTITASRKDCNLVVAPTLISYYGPKNGNHHRGRSLDNPVATQTTENRHGLVTAFLARHFGGMVARDLRLAFPTITQVGTQNQLVTTSIIKLRGTSRHGQPMDEPAPTITSGGTHIAEVRAFLMRHYSSGGQWSSLHAPAPTVTTKDRLSLGIVMIGQCPYQIVDIGMRMLTPRELFLAQGFPEDYIIDTGLNGKPASKREQVGRCGNSVSPQPAAALVKANFSPRPVPVAV